MSVKTLEIKRKIQGLVNFEGKKKKNKFAVLSETNKNHNPYRQILCCDFQNKESKERAFGFTQKEKESSLVKELI